MALVVEDGTGRSEADAYIALAYLKTYCEDRGLDLPADDADVERAIRRGSEAVDSLFGGSWLGVRVRADQGLDWPRRGVFVEGSALLSTELPRRLLKAVAEASWREASQPGVMVPDKDTGAVVSSESVGPISVSYAVGGSGRDTEPSVVFAGIENLLAPLLQDGGGSSSDTGVFYLRRA